MTVGRDVASARPWSVQQHLGSAAAFHALEIDATSPRAARWFSVDRPALVLGSAQQPTAADAEACARNGVEVVRRRSGGGAVLMIPGEIEWLDIVVPVGDPLWHDDVARAMWWLGEVWAEALRQGGVGGVDVHQGALVSTPWSRLVCWDSLGAGEVTVNGAKAVGISQRRTRNWVRLQSSIYQVWRAELLVELLAEPRPSAAELRAPFVADGFDSSTLRELVEDQLARLV